MENEIKKLENQTYKKDYIYDWLKNNHISQEKFAEMLDINYDTLRGYLSGNIGTPPIPVLKNIANIMGVTLDFLCYNDNNPDTFDEAMRKKWWLSPEITDYLMKYKTNYYEPSICIPQSFKVLYAFTDFSLSHSSSWKLYSIWYPLIPPAALISLIARSAPF